MLGLFDRQPHRLLTKGVSRGHPTSFACAAGVQSDGTCLIATRPSLRFRSETSDGLKVLSGTRDDFLGGDSAQRGLEIRD
jgi:hypothetical protein